MGEDEGDYSQINKYKVKYKGEKVKELLKTKRIDATLINPLYITGIDKDVLEKLKIDHQIVITLEDEIKNGGFWEKIASYYGDSDLKVLNYGAEKEFTDRVELEELYRKYRLTPELIVEDIEKILK